MHQCFVCAGLSTLIAHGQHWALPWFALDDSIHYTFYIVIIVMCVYPQPRQRSPTSTITTIYLYAQYSISMHFSTTVPADVSGAVARWRPSVGVVHCLEAFFPVRLMGWYLEDCRTRCTSVLWDSSERRRRGAATHRGPWVSPWVGEGAGVSTG